MCQNTKYYQKVKLRQGLKNVTSQGGLLLAGKIAVYAGFQSLVEKVVQLKKRLRGFSESHVLLATILGLISGAERVDDFKLFQKDQSLHQLLGGFSFPSPATILRFFQRMSLGHIKQLKKLNWLVYEKLAKPLPRRVTIDMDASLIASFGKKEGARYSYMKTLSHNPLMAFISETQEMISCQLRPGNFGSYKKFLPFLKEVLIRMKKKAKELIVRLDAGFFTREILTTLEEEAVGYIVGAYKSGAVMNIILDMKDAKWEPYRDGRWCAEFLYQGKAKKNNATRRYIVMRKERCPYAEPQLNLFEGAYEYHVVVTNLDWKPRKILDHYFKRGQCELLIREFKNGLGMSHLPFKRYMANWGYLLVGQLAYNFHVWLKHWALPKAWQTFTLKTLRFRLFHQPIRLVHSNKKPVAQLSMDYPWFDEFQSSWNQIEKLAA